MRRLPLLLLLALAAVGVAGCGNKTDVVTVAETEGIYVDVADLVYQVQISRILNPNDTEDRAYLKGLPPGEAELQPGETWFGVFMRVSNETSETLTPTTSFRIIDTQETEYEPIALDPEANPFGYQPAPIRPGQVYPDSESAAFQTPIQGALVLFRVEFRSLQNRPLELEIDGPQGGSAIVDLDV